MITDEVLETGKAIEFWNERHQSHGNLRSGGDLSFDEVSNEIFYALRLGRLLDLIGDRTSSTAPLRLLDAGCGKGYFSKSMARFGHRIDGIDTSAHAIDQCRQTATGRERYEVSTLAAWSPPYLYDVVFAVDVLFHIMDDEVWAESVANLASLVRFGGLLLIADHEMDADRVWGNYQKTRASSRYDQIAGRHGFLRSSFSRYGFRDSPAGFHAFVKAA